MCGSSEHPVSRQPSRMQHPGRAVLTLGGKGLKQCWWGVGECSYLSGGQMAESIQTVITNHILAQSCLLDFGVSELSPFSTRKV